VRARDRWHLTSRCNRKLLAHTVCFWLNRHSPDPLQFDDLVQYLRQKKRASGIELL
jgi:hypothetical protein